jgi:hypothetical protein
VCSPQEGHKAKVGSPNEAKRAPTCYDVGRQRDSKSALRKGLEHGSTEPPTFLLVFGTEDMLKSLREFYPNRNFIPRRDGKVRLPPPLPPSTQQQAAEG